MSNNSSHPNHQAEPMTLPLDGFSRAKQLLPFLPIGESTLWAWVKQSKFPQPIKLSPTVTAWANKDVHEWLNSHYENSKNKADTID